jgi:hypothetical protein
LRRTSSQVTLNLTTGEPSRASTTSSSITPGGGGVGGGMREGSIVTSSSPFAFATFDAPRQTPLHQSET